MKRKRVMSLIGLTLIAVMTVSVAHAREFGREGGDCRGQGSSIGELTYQEVDETERGDLLLMREEEKLARDVYRALDDLWGVRVFRNIAGAEESHMRAVLSLLDKYAIPDPVGDAQAGVFNDPRLQSLYAELMERGSQSLIDALLVGATIEDLDIHDLENALDRTDNEDIRTVYQNLQKGSRNHLRAFVGLLVDSGVPFEPQYISAEEFEAVMSTPWERGRVDADGNPLECSAGAGRRHRSGG